MNEALREKYGKQWNWGPFLVPGLWPLSHGYIWLGIIFLIIAITPLVFPAFRLECLVITIIGRIILGFKGNIIALSRRQFQSEKDFVDCQNVWRNVGAGLVAVFAVLTFFRIALAGLG